MTNFIEELRWRGMLSDMMPGTDEKLASGMQVAYVGFDPTSHSLHIGNLATLMLLVHFQRAGHKPIALVGGATGMVGDPSGKSAERNLLDEDTLRKNQEGVRKQVAQYLSFEGANAAEVVNNYDWFGGMGFLSFIRDVGKHLTVNYMMAKDSVKNRLETGLSFTEFSYQLLQAYDFYHLYKTKGASLQMGGSDQWGNITSGTELIRRMANGEAYAITTPLITKADGTKFGKSENGNIWLDPTMTSPYQFYQFWLNVADEEAPRLIRVFTVLDKETIEGIEAKHLEAPHLRILQKALAEDVTRSVHGQAELDKAVEATNILFGQASLEVLSSLDEATLLDVFSGVEKRTIAAADYQANKHNVTEVIAVLCGTMIYPSKGETRKSILAGALSINGIKVTDPAGPIDTPLLQGKYLLCRMGKKKYYLVTVA